MSQYNTEILNFKNEADSSARTSIQNSEYRDAELNSNDSYIPFGHTNDFPDKIRNYARESLKHSRCLRSISNYIAGNGVGFEGDDTEIELAQSLFDEVGLFNIHNEIASNIKTFGGCYVQLAYKTDVRKESNLNDVDTLDFWRTRLALRKKGRYPYVFLHRDWCMVTSTGSNVVDYKQLDNLSFIDKRDKVVRIPTYDRKRKGTQVYILKLDSILSEHYPQPDYYSKASLIALDTDFELTKFDYADLKNGLNLSYIATVVRSKNSDQQKEIEAQERDRTKIKDQLSGADNNGRVLVSWVEPSMENTKPVGIYLEPVPSANTEGRHNVLSDRTFSNLMTMHGVTNPKLVGFYKEKGSSLGNSANEVISDYEIMCAQVIKPMQRIIEDFYNKVLEDEGINARAFIKQLTPTNITMSDNLMDKYITGEEIVKAFGFDSSALKEGEGNELQ